MTDATRGTARGRIWTDPAMVTALVLLVFAIGAGLVGGWERAWLAVLVRDPAAQYDYPAYVGLLSHVGVMLMTAAAAMAGLGAAALWRPAPAMARTLAAVAALSGVLVLDDVFLLHEQAPRLGEVALFAFYGLCALAIARSLRRDHAGLDTRGLRVAIGFLALSVLTDVFKVYGPFAHWLEDFSKLAGFGAWAAFWGTTARAAILEAIDRGRPQP